MTGYPVVVCHIEWHRCVYQTMDPRSGVDQLLCQVKRLQLLGYQNYVSKQITLQLSAWIEKCFYYLMYHQSTC